MVVWLLFACMAPHKDTATPHAVALLTDLTEPVDECAALCVSLTGPASTAAAVIINGQTLSSDTIPDDGQLTLCIEEGALNIGDVLTVSVGDSAFTEVALDVRPFGYAWGRIRSATPLTAVRWDTDWIADPTPIFAPEPGSWYQRAITSPHLAEDRLYFSGKPTDNAPYRLGVTTRGADGTFPPSTAPLLETTWDAAGQVSPTTVQHPDGDVLFYHGLGWKDTVPTLGRSLWDGQSWVGEDDRVYGNGDADKISHPTAWVDQDSGVIELWHLTQEGSFQLSLSADMGMSFTPSCRSLPMRGKSPEVAWVDDRYVMTWSTQNADEDIIRWAESTDGLRWVVREGAILRASDADWLQDGLSNAQIVWLEHTPQLLLSGVEDGEHRFGLASPKQWEN